MRPGLTKELVRSTTAYRVGRAAVDILVALEWIGTVVFVALYFRAVPSFEGQAGLFAVSLAVASAVIGSALALAGRELGQAVFDIADCALTNRRATPEQ